MELEDIWLWYCEQRLGQPKERPDIEALEASEVLELLWTLHPLFTARSEAIAATPFSDAFNDEADGALAQMAIANSFKGWDRISAGAWRVLYERLVFCETVIILNQAQGDGFTTRLPAGLDQEDQMRALLLKLLLGEGRSIDRRLLARSPRGRAPSFPASTSLRRQ